MGGSGRHVGPDAGLACSVTLKHDLTWRRRVIECWVFTVQRPVEVTWRHSGAWCGERERPDADRIRSRRTRCIKLRSCPSGPSLESIRL
jgi:hypothetical protein